MKRPPTSPLLHKLRQRARQAGYRDGELDGMLVAAVVIVFAGGAALLTWGGR